MAKRPQGKRLAGFVMEAVSYDETGTLDPGGSWIITEDGQKLTLDEAFSLNDPENGKGPGARTPKTGKGPGPATLAAFRAFLYYEKHQGIMEHMGKTELALAVASYADKAGLPGADLLVPTNATMRELAGTALEAMKHRPPPA